MSDKFSKLIVEVVDDTKYRLVEDFTWNDVKGFGKVTVKKGFETDFASIHILKYMMLLILYALLSNYGKRPATIHDWFYSGGGVERDGKIYYPTRREADQMFYRALRDSGLARWRTMIFYVGVRLFGFFSYRT